MSRQTWQQLHGRGRHQGGYEHIPILQLKGVRLPTLTKQYSNVMVFRFDGMKPMLGLREGQKFLVFHLDRDMSAYAHN
jgi:hypothetical protein